MNKEETWLGQQIALLRTHLSELKALSTQERQARKDLKSKHQPERDRLLSQENNSSRLALALLRTQQAEALTQLMSLYSSQRVELLALQWEDYRKLTKTIELERRKSSY